MIGCLESRGVKYTPSLDRRVDFRVLLVTWEICLLDFFESTKDFSDDEMSCFVQEKEIRFRL